MYFKSFKYTWQTTISFFYSSLPVTDFCLFFCFRKIHFQTETHETSMGKDDRWSDSDREAHSSVCTQEEAVTKAPWGRIAVNRSTTPKNIPVIHRATGNRFLCFVAGWSFLTDALIHLWVLFHSCKSRQWWHCTLFCSCSV